MGYVPAGDQLEIGRELKQAYNINPTTNCQGCHR
jgi:hypothetical protein